MTDLDTSQYLEQFKEEYLRKMQVIHEKNQPRLMSMNDTDYLNAKEIEKKYLFLSNFVASIEQSLEQNLALKMKLSATK